MIGTSRTVTMTRWLSLALIAVALLARVIVPQGWMPTASSHGWQITLCSGSGPMTMAMPEAMSSALDHGDHHKSGEGRGPSDHPCGFGGLAAALDGPRAMPAPFVPAEAILLRPAALFVVSIGRGLVAPPPPSTGPPAIL